MTSIWNLQAEREKRRASFLTVSAVLSLIVLKVAVGLITNSLGILAQAADSVLDMVASVMAFFAVRVADQPPDAGHPYGHGKVDNLTALGETLLLLVTCGWIVYEALKRLFSPPQALEGGLWGIGVMLFSIFMSIWLSTYLLKVARRHRSQSLEGNALNFRADVLSGLVVLLGLVLASLSARLGHEWAWLAKADAAAALFVALFVLRVSLRLGWGAVSELLDAAPPGLAERVAAEAMQVSGVQDVGPVRVRRAGADTFVDLTVRVDRSASLEEAHRVATTVERQVGTLLHQGDVVVHVDPIRQRDESLSQTASAIAARLGLRTHNVHAHEWQGRHFVDLHVEMPADMTLAEAHKLIVRLEAAMRAELSQISDVHTRIEPLAVPTASAALDSDVGERLREQILAVVEEVPGLHGCHDLHVRPGPDGHDVVLHCQADPALTVAQAHRLADRAERQVHARVPETGQVLIHVEPEGED